MIIVGVDVGSGVKSATGVCFFDTVGMNIETHAIMPDNRKAEANQRLINISRKFSNLLFENPKFAIVAFESFMMRGKSGESLQRLIGALMSNILDEALIVEVPNTVVKQLIGGSGRSEKEEVANGLHAYFLRKNKSSADYIQLLKHEARWDEVDACAIAVAAFLKRKD